jgi:hypothetical protein
VQVREREKDGERGSEGGRQSERFRKRRWVEDEEGLRSHHARSGSLRRRGSGSMEVEA